jgi:hypothetical protein
VAVPEDAAQPPVLAPTADGTEWSLTLLHCFN